MVPTLGPSSGLTLFAARVPSDEIGTFVAPVATVNNGVVLRSALTLSSVSPHLTTGVLPDVNVSVSALEHRLAANGIKVPLGASLSNSQPLPGEPPGGTYSTQVTPNRSVLMLIQSSGAKLSLPSGGISVRSEPARLLSSPVMPRYQTRPSATCWLAWVTAAPARRHRLSSPRALRGSRAHTAPAPSRLLPEQAPQSAFIKQPGRAGAEKAFHLICPRPRVGQNTNLIRGSTQPVRLKRTSSRDGRTG